MKYWRKPLDADEIEIPLGEVRVIIDRCKGCTFCIEHCPKDVLEMSEEVNRKGYHYPIAVTQGECVNCSLCEMICPDFAIYSVLMNGDGEGERRQGESSREEGP